MNALIEFVFYALWCLLSWFLGWFGKRIDRPQPEWDEMSAWRKAARLLLTVLGTAAFVSPFVWFAWRLAQK